MKRKKTGTAIFLCAIALLLSGINAAAADPTLKRRRKRAAAFLSPASRERGKTGMLVWLKREIPRRWRKCLQKSLGLIFS